MKIELEEGFSDRFERQLRFIAEDSPSRARKFKADILREIKSLPHNPLRCRKSIYFDDSNIRDLIFKGYTITYRIKPKLLEVFGFTKYQKDCQD